MRSVDFTSIQVLAKLSSAHCGRRKRLKYNGIILQRTGQVLLRSALVALVCCGYAQRRTQVYDYIIKKSLFQVKLFISKKFFPARTQGIKIFFRRDLLGKENFQGSRFFFRFYYSSLRFFHPIKPI